MDFKDKEVLLIGSGYMAREYLLVLTNLGCRVIIIGRGEEKIALLKAEFPDFKFHVGGLESYLKLSDNHPDFAINAVNVNYLKEISILLIQSGVKNILIEKPGDLTNEGLKKIKNCAEMHDSNIQIAYNRRFYSSILALKEQAVLDGGVTSAHFEFTEWIHTIDPAIYDEHTLARWIIANSSHVIDAAFNIIGPPASLNANVTGLNAIDWHPSGAVFSGNGLSVNDIPFTYHSNWQSAGRWAIEVFTNRRRFYLKPMEKLQVQMRGSVIIEEFPIEDDFDHRFKPGLYRQTLAFLTHDYSKLVSLDDQIKNNPIYEKIGGYRY